MPQCRRVTAELLADGHGHGVLQVSAPRLHRFHVFFALFLKRVCEAVKLLEQRLKCRQHCYVRGGWERVVCGLSHVDLVVWTYVFVVAFLFS